MTTQQERAAELLRQVRETVEFWTPDESVATAAEMPMLNAWYALRDKLDAHIRALAAQEQPAAVAWAIYWRSGGLSSVTAVEPSPDNLYRGSDDEQYAVPLYAHPAAPQAAPQERTGSEACSMCRGVGSHGEPPAYCQWCKGTGKEPWA